MTTQETVEDFEVVFEPEEQGGFHVFCPALRGCHSDGETKDEARENIVDAIRLWLETARDLGYPIPDRETVLVPPDRVPVSPP